MVVLLNRQNDKFARVFFVVAVVLRRRLCRRHRRPDSEDVYQKKTLNDENRKQANSLNE